MSLFNELEKLSNETKSLQTSRWTGTFKEFLRLFETGEYENMGVLSHRRVANMINDAGVSTSSYYGEERKSYKFFEYDLYGIEKTIDEIMSYINSAAQRTETARRMLLLFGPPSSGKSQVVTLIKKGLEKYTRTKKGAIFALAGSKMHENPFLLIPHDMREEFNKHYNLQIEGELSPMSRWRLQNQFGGKFMDFPVEQIFLSESDRIGIGTWLPSDSKTVATDSTRIFTDDGILRVSKIFSSVSDHLNSEGLATLSLHSAAFGEDERIKGIYDHGFLPMYRVNAGGVYLDGTLNHRVMTLNTDGDFEWKTIDTIDDSTPIVIKSGMLKFGKDARLSDYEGRSQKVSVPIASTLGFLVSEGACTQSNIAFVTTDQSLSQEFKSNVCETFLVEPTVKKRTFYDNDGGGGVQTKIRKPIYRCFLSASLSRWLVFNFEVDELACNKKVPDKILAASRESQIAFLNSLFLGDGCIRYRCQVTPSFMYGTCSEVLALDVQSMLLNLGVYCYITTHRNKRYPAHEQFKVVCEGNHVYKIAELFPSFAKHRGFIIPEVKPNHKTQYEYFGSLSGLINEIRKYTKGTRSLIDRRYCINTHNKRAPRRSTLEHWYKELSENIEWTCVDKKTYILKKLKKILAYHPVRLLSKKYIGVCHGIDLSCDSDMYSYVANGLISHNSQDISELVGSIDLSKIQEVGDESDPRAYNFDGELNVANRGIMEFIEGLKSDEKFLRSNLTATQEKSIKAPRFGLIYVDTFIILHSNETEFRNFMHEKKYEAYHDRMVIIRVPYNLTMSDEVRIYRKLLDNSDATKGIYISPNTLEAAAIFSVLTRMEPPEDGLSLVKKMKLYNNEHVKGYKIEQVPDIRKKCPLEGMYGVSPRFVIDQISAAISKARDENRDFITPLDVLRQLNSGVRNRDSFKPEEKLKFEEYIDIARNEWNDMLRVDIQKAFFLSFEDEARALCDNYIDHINAACSNHKIRDPITGDEKDPDEKLMNEIEDHLDVSSSGKEDFRNEILRAVASASLANRKFDYSQHSQLREAIQSQLFTERQGTIRMTVSTRNPEPESLRRLNEVIDRMVQQQGYSPAAANELLKYATAHLFEK